MDLLDVPIPTQKHTALCRKRGIFLLFSLHFQFLILTKMSVQVDGSSGK